MIFIFLGHILIKINSQNNFIKKWTILPNCLPAMMHATRLSITKSSTQAIIQLKLTQNCLYIWQCPWSSQPPTFEVCATNGFWVRDIQNWITKSWQKQALFSGLRNYSSKSFKGCQRYNFSCITLKISIRLEHYVSQVFTNICWNL